MLDLTHPEISFAVDAARLAGQLARGVQSALVEPAITKDDKSPVTVADFAVQALVACLLEKAFPGDPLVGEESARALREADNAGTLSKVTSFVSKFLAYSTPETVCGWIDRGAAQPTNRFWTLDPIDGTKGFLRRDQYAVALALVVDGQVKVGALACPDLVNGCEPEPSGPGSIIVAARSKGAWTQSMDAPADWKQLRASGIDRPEDARVLRSFESGHTNVDQLDVLLQHMNNQAGPVRMDSQAKYGVLAAGKGDILLRLLSSKQPDYKEMIWDQAAGSIIVEESGGRITDLSGKALDFSAGRRLERNSGVLATNGRLHEAALAALKKL